MKNHIFLPVILASTVFFAAPEGRPEDPSVKAKEAGERTRDIPEFKKEEDGEKFQTALERIETREYSEARRLFMSCQRGAATKDDRKLVDGYMDDARLGLEIESARKMTERKNQERKAITKVEKALDKYPESLLVPDGEEFILELEELIYLVLDDFEPGGSLARKGQKNTPSKESEIPSSLFSETRWKKTHAFNSIPEYVKHGKGSLKWILGGESYYGSSSSYYYYGYGYQSAELKNPITKYRYLVFWIYLPKGDEGALRVTLAPTDSTSVYTSLYAKKFIDLRGKRGWIQVGLDLRKDFGNTDNIPLEDIRFVRIDSMHIRRRTVYLDFVHFE